MTSKTNTSLILATTLMVSIALTPVAFASEDQVTYRDQFNQISYTGSDGSLTWSNPWEEVGESDGASDGAVRVVSDSLCASGRCLRVRSETFAIDMFGADRLADASIFSDAVLSYHLQSRFLGLPLGVFAGDVEVQVTTDHGTSWTTVDGWAIADLSGQPKIRVLSINGFLSRGFGVRFVVDGLIGGEMFVDNVEIRGTLRPSTTTTTTSPTTTTTAPTTTTTEAGATNSTTASGGGGDSPTRDRTDATTSTTLPPSTTTIVGETRITDSPEGAMPGSEALPIDFGEMRHAEHGLQVGYDMGLFGDTDMVRPEVLGLSVDYRMAVEVVSSSWLGLVALVLLITAALVHGLDRRNPGDPG